MKRTLTSIICPNGCSLEVEKEGEEITVKGNLCRRGAEYAREELTAPKRTISSSMRLVGGDMEIVSVRLDRPVPKEMIFPVMDAIKSASAEAPVHIGDVLLHDVLSTGADVIATRNAERKEGR